MVRCPSLNRISSHTQCHLMRTPLLEVLSTKRRNQVNSASAICQAIFINLNYGGKTDATRTAFPSVYRCGIRRLQTIKRGLGLHSSCSLAPVTRAKHCRHRPSVSADGCISTVSSPTSPLRVRLYHLLSPAPQRLSLVGDLSSLPRCRDFNFSAFGSDRGVYVLQTFQIYS